MTASELIQNHITQQFPELAARDDDQLLNEIWPVASTAIEGPGLAGGTARERLEEWIRTDFMRKCRAGGERGRDVLKMISDEESAQNIERVTLVIQFLVANYTHFEHLELHVMATLAILVLRTAFKITSKTPK